MSFTDEPRLKTRVVSASTKFGKAANSNDWKGKVLLNKISDSELQSRSTLLILQILAAVAQFAAFYSVLTVELQISARKPTRLNPRIPAFAPFPQLPHSTTSPLPSTLPLYQPPSLLIFSVSSSAVYSATNMAAPAVRVARTAATRARSLLATVQYNHPPNCPCHSNPNHHHHHKTPSLMNHVRRHLATPTDPSREKEYAFEMAASSIRFGPGSTKEVGMDFKNMGAKRVCIVTDSTVAKLDAMKQAVEGLTREGIEFTIYDKVRVEPKDSSVKDAIAFAKPYNPDAFLAVGMSA